MAGRGYNQGPGMVPPNSVPQEYAPQGFQQPSPPPQQAPYQQPPQQGPYQQQAPPQTPYQQHAQQHAPPQAPPYQQTIPSQQFAPPYGQQSLVSKKPDTYTFELDYFSPELELHYKGTFTVQRPRMGKQMLLEARKTELLGGYHYDPANPGCGTSGINMRFAEAMAFLEVCLVQWPPWWTGCEDVEDPMIIELLYEEAQKVDPFREVSIPAGQRPGGEAPHVHGEPGEASGNQHHNAGPGDLLESMVDEEIQPAGNESPMVADGARGSGGGVSGGDAPEK